MSEERIRLTRFTTTDDSELNKKFSLDEGRAIRKSSNAQFSKGVAKAVVLDHGISDLPALIGDLEPIECLATGVFDVEKCRVVPSNGNNDKPSSLPVRNRTKEAMKQPSSGLVLFDYDPSPRMPSPLKCDSSGKLMSLLGKAVPALKKVAWAGRGSSSTGIFNKATKEPYSSQGGIHIFIEVEIEDLDLLKKNLETALWLAGYGYVEIASNGRRLLRTIIDLSVLSPERLIFEAEPELGLGVGRTAPEWTVQEGVRLQLSDFNLTEADHERANRLQSEAMEEQEVLEEAEATYERYRNEQAGKIAEMQRIPKEEALQRLPRYDSAAIEKSVVELPPDHPIEIRGEWLTTDEVFRRATEFDGASLPDPIEGRDYGTSNARLYANGENGNPVIHSWAHGISTSYILGRTKKRKSIEKGPISPTNAAPSTPPALNEEKCDLAYRLDPERFPHLIGAGENHRPQSTVENFRSMLEQYGITVRYNVISKELEINIPGMQGSPDNWLQVATTRIESLMTLNGMRSACCSKYLTAIADEQQYNPIADWIDSRPWDGEDRLPKLFDTLTVQQEFPVELRDKILYRWLLSAVAAVLQPQGFHSRGVLTLQGPQSIGKTSWIRALVSEPVLQEKYVLEGHHLDPGNKDSVFIAVSHWIVELGELDSSFKRDVARIKGFITMKYDKLRKPYAGAPSKYQRRTVFAASVNEDNFLVDPTGNTRWLVLPVTAINFNHGIDMQQVFAQLAVDFRNGERWWLTREEEARLEELNQSHTAVSVIEERILAAIDMELPKSAWQRLTATETLEQIGFDKPTNAQARECGAILRRLIGRSRKIRGRTVWGIPFRKRDV